jgi:hypothetical protein
MTDAMMSDDQQPATKRDLRNLKDGLGAQLESHDRRFVSIEGNLHRLNVGFAQMHGDMTEVKGKLDILLDVKDQFSRFTTRVERMTNYFESRVRKMDSQGAMPMEHEGRLQKFEARPSA